MHVIDDLLTNLRFGLLIKDLGQLSYFLGIKINFDLDRFFLCREKYIQDIRHLTNMINAKLVATPMASTHNLTLFDNDAFHDPTLYRKPVGGLD